MLDNYTLGQRSLYHDPTDTLFLADLHLGKSDHATTPDMTPAPAHHHNRTPHSDFRQRTQSLLEHYTPDALVVAGDVFHHTAGIPESVFITLDWLANRADDCDTTLVLLPGNHDEHGFQQLVDYPGNIHREREYATDGLVALHGHIRPTQGADQYITGHLHPAHADQPCFLYHEAGYDDTPVLAIPAFNPSLSGFDPTQKTLSDDASEFYAASPPLSEYQRIVP